jgi:hypothetical protein
MLTEHYPRGVRFVVNGAPLEPEAWQAPERAPIAVRLPRKRRPAAAGYLVRERTPLPEERSGLAISTFGKVIRRGWEWLGLAPSSPALIGGVIEVPALAQALTLNKADFIRTGPRGAIYLAYRKAIQEAVASQLGEWGDLREAGPEARRRAARPVERDLEAVLIDLADEFPLLSALVERRAGGQRSLPMGRGAGMPESASTPVPSAGSPAKAPAETAADVAPTAEQPASESGVAEPAAHPPVEMTPSGSGGPR